MIDKDWSEVLGKMEALIKEHDDITAKIWENTTKHSLKR